MPSVPSHDRSFFQEAIDRAGSPAHRFPPPQRRSPSTLLIPSPTISSTSRFTNHSRSRPSRAIHLLTWCTGQTGSPMGVTRRLR